MEIISASTSLGEQSSKMISQKYRNIHPSYIGAIDINVSSNSDVGMSGAFTPFVKIYDKYYFTPDREPCMAMYNLRQEQKNFYDKVGKDQMLYQDPEVSFNSYDDYLTFMKEEGQNPGLKPEPIRIVEKEPDEAPEQAKLLQMTEEEREKAIEEQTKKEAEEAALNEETPAETAVEAESEE